MKPWMPTNSLIKKNFFLFKYFNYLKPSEYYQQNSLSDDAYHLI